MQTYLCSPFYTLVTFLVLVVVVIICGNTCYLVDLPIQCMFR